MTSASGPEYSLDVLYDCMHYALHHTRLPAYLREQKKYHLAHHYKNFDLGFGVTSQYFIFVMFLLMVLNKTRQAKFGITFLALCWRYKVRDTRFDEGFYLRR